MQERICVRLLQNRFVILLRDRYESLKVGFLNTVKVGESVYYSKPLIEYAPESNATKAYKNLAKELINYEG